MTKQNALAVAISNANYVMSREAKAAEALKPKINFTELRINPAVDELPFDDGARCWGAFAVIVVALGLLAYVSYILDVAK